jgi:hypothetical protein
MKTTYKTRDLNFAAFLWCQDGTSLVNCETPEGRSGVVFFNFSLPFDRDALDALQVRYYNDDVHVSPKEFCEKQSNLRDLIHGRLGASSAGEAKDE